jgi:hypothetical protein
MNRLRTRIIWATVGLFLTLAGPATADMIFIDMVPSQYEMDIDQSFDLTIKANITKELLGFGFDLMYDNQIFAVENISFPDTMLPLPTRDGDGLAAMGFSNNRLGELIGNDVILATITFRKLSEGSSAISVDYTRGDPSEGFPEKGGSFATPHVNETQVGAPIPEPPIFAMFLIPTLGIIIWKTLLRPEQKW